MFGTPVRNVMQPRHLLKATPVDVVAKVARAMAKKNVGAAMVVQGGRLLGIFTERDIVFRVVAHGLDAKTTPVGEVMTPNPEVVHPDKPFGHALLIMHDKGFRHLPVVENDKLIGIVSARSAMDPDLEEFTAEAHRRSYLQSAK
jgi:CBS domain-containing protein